MFKALVPPVVRKRGRPARYIISVDPQALDESLKRRACPTSSIEKNVLLGFAHSLKAMSRRKHIAHFMGLTNERFDELAAELIAEGQLFRTRDGLYRTHKICHSKHR